MVKFSWIVRDLTKWPYLFHYSITWIGAFLEAYSISKASESMVYLWYLSRFTYMFCWLVAQGYIRITLWCFWYQTAHPWLKGSALGGGSWGLPLYSGSLYSPERGLGTGPAKSPPGGPIRGLLWKFKNIAMYFTWIWETCLAWYQQAVITGIEIGAGRNLSHWIINSADYLQPIKMLILSFELFSVLTQWVVFYIVHYIMQSAMMIYI